MSTWRWRDGINELIAAGDYAPTTANSWLSILRVIAKAAKREFGLEHLATEGIEDFDISEHVTYSEEQPNALRMYPRYPIYRATGGDGMTVRWTTPTQNMPVAARYGSICSTDSLGWASA
jgi:hypothetical protein